MSYEGYGYQMSPFDFFDSEPQTAEPSPNDLLQQDSSVARPFSNMPAWFQVPSVLATGPNLASGGGAEVLPIAFQDEQAIWMAQSTYSRHSNPLCAEKLQIREIESYEHVIPQTPGVIAEPFDFEPLPAPVPTNPQARSTPLLTSSDSINHFLQNDILNCTPTSKQHREQRAAAEERVVSLSATLLPPPQPTSITTNASTLGLPVYSASGFDLLSILARVATRPYPRVHLGPVDLTCAFVVVDTRRHDHPIVYCSPNFQNLSGYPENEVLGRNCRFLQSPTGQLAPGAQRPDAPSQQAAAHLKKNLDADKECQIVITNYRKDGTQFTNMVTVIPISGGVSGGAHEEHDVVFHVGFQVDLTEQPNAILEKLKNGSYLIDYSSQSFMPPNNKGLVGSGSRDRRSSSMPNVMMSKDLKKLLKDPAFISSVPITTITNHPAPTPSSPSDPQDSVHGGNHPLHMMLLETGPDFIHVVSLKGTFLYVAPSIRRVLGYEPQDLVGKSIADLAHSEDVVPLMRELKECSSTGINAVGGSADGGGMGSIAAQSIIVPPRVVDLMFRAKTKNGAYVWVESRGRLHVEPGKGRKAILLSGRAKEIPKLTWGMVAQGGGLAKMRKVQRRRPDGNGGTVAEDVDLWQEFWGTISHGMMMLMIGKGFSDVSGWSREEWRGRNFRKLLADSGSLDMIVARLNQYGPTECEEMVHGTTCSLRKKDGSVVDVLVNVYRPERDINVMMAPLRPGGIQPAHLMIQVRLAGAEVYSLLPSSSSLTNPKKRSFADYSNADHIVDECKTGDLYSAGDMDLSANIFEELETSRGSSWQYELQQLKYTNQRLMDEITALEAAVKIHSRCALSPTFSNGLRTRSSSNASTSANSSLLHRRHQQRMQLDYPSIRQAQPSQQQHPHGHPMASTTLITNMPYLPSAELPARTSSRSNDTRIGGGGDWQTSPAFGNASFVRRIQEEVHNGSGMGSSLYPLTSSVSAALMTRSWGPYDDLQ
ncbi:hypothetical protein FA15DRAFT_659489 [Coprinopsis marcescibilis]|uniref:PAS domain-containing protein n=1 Tax=Coprinopsis marcescibilis TaxID=230819 RepID=A0A5C3KI51_COPMA|nr:hypothetical protein FA15DRAFT_659489 [Coprinopsis marcescibilis]